MYTALAVKSNQIKSLDLFSIKTKHNFTFNIERFRNLRKCAWRARTAEYWGRTVTRRWWCWRKKVGRKDRRYEFRRRPLGHCQPFPWSRSLGNYLWCVISRDHFYTLIGPFSYTSIILTAPCVYLTQFSLSLSLSLSLIFFMFWTCVKESRENQKNYSTIRPFYYY